MAKADFVANKHFIAFAGIAGGTGRIADPTQTALANFSIHSTIHSEHSSSFKCSNCWLIVAGLGIVGVAGRSGRPGLGQRRHQLYYTLL